MNWTHRITFEDLAGKPQYLIDIHNPSVCEDAATGRQYIDKGEGGWLRWWKGRKGITFEELNFSLENE